MAENIVESKIQEKDVVELKLWELTDYQCYLKL